MSKPIKELPNSVFTHLMTDEGTYVFDHDDPGGETYCGISREHFPSNEIWEQVDKLKNEGTNLKSRLVFRKLAPLVKKFYYSEFWRKHKIYQVDDIRLANAMLNQLVLGGGGARITLQSACNDLNIYYNSPAEPLKIDGIIGEKTIGAVNYCYHNELANDLLLKFVYLRKDKYYNIVAEQPKKRKYLKGWQRRCNRLIFWEDK